MSQSATLYRISEDTFEQLKSSDSARRFKTSSAKNYTTFQGSFMGLEYVLSKGQDQQITELMGEIFNPKEHLGGGDFENLTHEEQFKLYESGSIIPYLSIATVAKINDLLNQVTQANFEANYNANELNKNGIYPCVWHNDNSLS
jgi:hypothetical protein